MAHYSKVNRLPTKYSYPIARRLPFTHCVLFLASTLVIFFFPQFGKVSLAGQTDQEKLTELKTRIQELQAELKADNQQKDNAVYLLQLAEKEVANARKKLRQTENEYNTSQQKLVSLNQEKKQLRHQMATNRDYLTNQIRAAYSIGKQEYVKLLLNQEDPASVARMMVYYQYFNQSRANQLQRIDKRLTRLKTISSEIETQSEKLNALKLAALNEQEILKSHRNKRSSVVANLSVTLKKKNNLLNSLLRDEQHLKKLLQEIETQINDVQLELSPPREFKQLKGQLGWPTTGTITARFGSTRKNSGNLKWKGVVIRTEAGNTVKSVAYGRVVFADWLRGFGMLIIIDHGDGYMSLYGHNEQLHKNIGDWVQANETIATSGHTGGQMATSLYFEIRHKGKPQDPVKWCKSLPARS
ncbi:murein hydrolase activator EnvC family protein [Kaarinaea lacus]